MNTKPYKYPIDIEFTNNCALNCVSCINNKLKNKGYITPETLDIIIEFILNNKEDIVYISIGGLGDSFLHKDVIFMLNKLLKIKDTGIFVVFPTKGNSWNEEIITKLEELRKVFKGEIAIQFGIYSIREKIYNQMCGNKSDSDINHYRNLMELFKKLKARNFDFCLELLMTKFSKDEIDAFKKFCAKLGVDSIIHRLHNFGGKLDSYENLYTEGETDPYHNYNGMCGFKPYINWNGDIHTGTFCTHIDVGNIKKYVYEGGFVKMIEDCYDLIDFKNENCLNCSDSMVNTRTKIINPA